MTEIYLNFLFAHYGLYGNAPVWSRMCRDDDGDDDAAAAANKLEVKLCCKAGRRNACSISCVACNASRSVVAVVVPAALGLVWMVSPSMVFFFGAGFALLSLLAAQLIPRHPVQGHEVCFPMSRRVAGEGHA